MGNKYFWETKDGKKIDVDTMDIEHLRNIVKMIIRKGLEDDEYYDTEPYCDDYLRK